MTLLTLGPFIVDAAIANILEIANQGNALVENARLGNFRRIARGFKDDQLDAVLYALAESLRIIAILISPVLPKAAHGIFDQLNWKMELSGKEERFRLEDAKWGGLPDGHVVGKPVPLFPRIENVASGSARVSRVWFRRLAETDFP